ncbi:MAG: GNAT family N-acetyltransferase [Planctomycetota bacterium]
MLIRAAVANDRERLSAIYADAVRAAAPGRYSPEQVDAWADAAERAASSALAADHETWVAEIDDVVAGWGSLDRRNEPAGRVAYLYIAGDFQRRCVGDALLQTIEQRARELGHSHLTSEASFLSIGLFLRRGYHETEQEVVDWGPVQFRRHLVRKDL